MGKREKIMRRDIATHDFYLKIASTIAKMAVDRCITSTDKQTDLYYNALKNAGWLAWHAKDFQEAKRLAHLGLNGQPPAWEKMKLEELAKAVAESEKANTVAQTDLNNQLS